MVNFFSKIHKKLKVFQKTVSRYRVVQNTSFWHEFKDNFILLKLFLVISKTKIQYLISTPACLFPKVSARNEIIVSPRIIPSPPLRIAQPSNSPTRTEMPRCHCYVIKRFADLIQIRQTYVRNKFPNGISKITINYNSHACTYIKFQ